MHPLNPSSQRAPVSWKGSGPPPIKMFPAVFNIWSKPCSTKPFTEFYKNNGLFSKSRMALNFTAERWQIKSGKLFIFVNSYFKNRK